MTMLYTPEQALFWRRRASRSLWLIRALFAFALLAAVLLCCFTNTRNALLLQWIAVGEFTLLGILAIVLTALVYRPAKAEAAHMDSILSAAPETMAGRLTLTGQSFAIPKSVVIRKMTLQTVSETQTLNLDASLLSRLPSASFPAEVQVSRYFVTAFRPLSPEETAALLPDDAQGPESGASSASSLRRRSPSLFRRVLSLFPMLAAWATLSLIVWCWVFSLVTDTVPAHKVVLFVDGTVTHATDLAAALETGLPDGVRMVQVRPFSYAMMDGDAIRSADLFILPLSETSSYLDWFIPLPDLCGFPEDEVFSSDGLLLGLPVYRSGTCLCAAGSCIQYLTDAAPDEPWYLFFGAQSLHVPGNPGAMDDAALTVARTLLSSR